MLVFLSVLKEIFGGLPAALQILQTLDRMFTKPTEQKISEGESSNSQKINKIEETGRP